ncbi:MAG TPA: DUF362 domain-containing protein [Thermodesulfovibrionales bacterium]|jgi:uncharacterized protein (DUF362 family)/Pyruvate/2-oxoacid:ferredoxin oxidoreductase delta subunit|nr:DUF362 domain-containing protein [Thermodesulfovibrionales bacterium]
MKKSRVTIRSASYDYGTLRPLVFEMIDFFCGRTVKKGSRVLIKPNLLAPARPERAMVTHPMVVKAVVEWVIQKGARPQISDSPAMGGFEKVLNESGIRDVLNGLEVEFREFRESVTFDTGEPFKKIEIAKDALEADLLINVPKLKTHAQMRMTLGVKNLFGCIVGLRKPEWHLRTGVNRDLFSALLVKVHHALKPAVTVLDGILAMEGQGPGKSGTPRKLGIIAASDDTYALDISICRMLGIDPHDVFTNNAAREMGYTGGEIEVIGEVPVVDNFKFPDISPVVFGPEMLHGFIRRNLVQRPMQDISECKLCGECWKYCPARAISQKGHEVRVDYDKCIRCYCCIEVCPHAALRIEEPLLGKLFRRLRR